MAKQRVTFTTPDGVMIVGDYWESPSERAVLLLHMMKADRSSWKPIEEDLWRLGYKVLAIDLRGHGESTRQGAKTLDYKKFSDAEHQESIRDVEAAVDFLKSKGAKSFAIVGASIGANLALTYGMGDSSVKTVILLSASLDYYGIRTEDAAAEFNKPMLIVASEEDTYSAESSQTLSKAAPKAELKILHNVGHGTQMFSSAELKPLILERLRENL
jgi:alpha-beta hydrolase superfamily lysophospholipase